MPAMEYCEHATLVVVTGCLSSPECPTSTAGQRPACHVLYHHVCLPVKAAAWMEMELASS